MDIYFNYSRVDGEHYVHQLEPLLHTLQGIDNLYCDQSGTNGNPWWEQANQQVRNAIILVLVTPGWTDRQTWDLQLQSYHQRPYVIVKCDPNAKVDASKLPKDLTNLPDDWVNLVDVKGQLIEAEKDDVLNRVTGFINDNWTASTLKSLHYGAKNNKLANRIDTAKSWIDRLTAFAKSAWGLAAIVITVVVVVVLILNGAHIQLEQFIPSFIALPSPTPILPVARTSIPNDACIAYHKGTNASGYNIWLLCDGNAPVNLTENAAGFDNSNVDWSCDGSMLAYTSNANAADYDIMVYNTTTGDSRRITTPDFTEGSITFAPDSTWDNLRFAYVAQPDANSKFEIYLLTVANDQITNNRRLTENGVDEYGLEWGCANNNLVFESGAVFDSTGRVDIVTMDMTTIPAQTNPRLINVTANPDEPFHEWRARFPSWTCDGLQLVYSASSDGSIDSELFLMDGDGQNVSRLTEDDVNQIAPSISPDGRYITFYSFPDNVDPAARTSADEIYYFDTTLRRFFKLTDTPSERTFHPAWQPTGSCS